jgi:hypothetical protein
VGRRTLIGGRRQGRGRGHDAVDRTRGFARREGQSRAHSADDRSRARAYDGRGIADRARGRQEPQGQSGQNRKP